MILNFIAFSDITKSSYTMAYMNKSKTDSHGTPKKLLKEIAESFGTLSTFDPCPLNDNPEIDGLKIHWYDYMPDKEAILFINPPYSKLKSTKHRLGWIEKIYMSARTWQSPIKIIVLLPVRTDTQWFHDYILKKGKIKYIRGRLTFEGSSNPAPFPSMLWCLNL